MGNAAHERTANELKKKIMNSKETTSVPGVPPGTDKKRKKRRALVWAAVSVFLVMLGTFTFLHQSFTVLIRDIDARYYRAKKVAIIGNTMLCFREPGDYPNRGQAMAGGEVAFRPSVISMKTVAFIEIIPIAEDMQDVDTGPLGFPSRHLGMYRVNAAGNDGYLFLGVKNGAVYGFIRFPEWGKGVAEPLKGLRITSRRIQFVRSITTLRELNSTGANTYFTQHYYGEFTANSKGIQGFYLVSGQKKQWQAYKTR